MGVAGIAAAFFDAELDRAERRGRRVIFFGPVQLSVEKRGRTTNSTPGTSARMIRLAVSAPRNMVSE